MRVLFLNQFYYPDLAATSLYLFDLTLGIGEGVDASVICSAENYVSGTERIATPVRIIRLTPTGPFRFDRIRRVGSYGVFLLRSAWTGFRVPRQDVVLAMTTPPFLGVVGYLLKALRGSRFFIWEMDSYPEIAFDLGVLRRDGLLGRLLLRLANRVRRSADGIIVLGECMRARLLAQGVEDRKIHVVENWADGSWVRELPLPTGQTLVVLYSGNLGRAHDEATLRAVISTLRDDINFRFVISGGGLRRAQLEAWCDAEGIRNVEFLPYCAPEDFPESLSRGHIGLVSQAAETLGAMVPSKTYAILAAGRPLLSIGPSAGTPARIIDRHGCGWHFENGNAEGIVLLLRELQAELRLGWAGSRIARAGDRGRRAFEAEYERYVNVEKILSVMGIPVSTTDAGGRDPRVPAEASQALSAGAGRL